MTGKLYVVGFGPGNLENMTVKAVEVIKSSDIITGYTTYIDILKENFPDKNYKATGMMKEIERCKMAIEDTIAGNVVAIVSSGDSGIYGMAGIIYKIAEDMNADIEIETIPGVTASSASASILGAPLMHDFSTISLSDLLTPLDLIMKRVDKAAESDMIICFYNPKSKGRTEYLNMATDLLLKYRSPDTIVGIVNSAGRKDEKKNIIKLSELKDAEVDMFSMVIVGNSQTYISNGRMITPRGYENKMNQGA